MIQIKVLILFGLCSLSQSKNRFMPNLPLGEYRVVFDKLYPCESTKNHSIQFNMFFSKKSLREIELKGNVTSFIPFDDTLTLDVNLASWGSTGGWKPYSYVHQTKNACTNMKILGGNAWFFFLNGFNIPTDSCPLPAGTYTTSGVDLKKIEDQNFPKVYFYGKYKMVFKFKNMENKLVGCEVAEFDLIRPWETPI